MKMKIALVLVVAMLIAMAAPVFAVAPGKTVEYDGKGAGKVIFDGKIHAGKGTKCAECHPKLFKYKKGTEVFTMKDMNEGKYCGACHDGTKTFGMKDQKDCSKCHKK